jgi:hypothetical protein
MQSVRLQRDLRINLHLAVDHVPILRPDLGTDFDSPFARDASNKLVRRGYWLDMNDRSLVMVMTNGIGAYLTNEESAFDRFEARPSN